MTVALRDVVGNALPPAQNTVERIRTSVSVHRDIAAIETVWRQLAASQSIASPYQSFDWVSLWHRYVSGPLGQEPMIVVGRDASGVPAFIWPLVIKALGPLRIATFFGGKHATLNMAHWRTDVAETFSAADMRETLSDIARQRPNVDLMFLHSQPASWNGTRNPFMALPHQRADKDNLVLHFGPGASAEASLAQSVRRRLRKKERKLAELPGYRYLTAASTDDVERMLDRFFQQKAAKLRSLGIANVFAQPGIEDFIRAACRHGLPSGQPLIELHALEVDGDMPALFSGIHDGQRFSLMFNSHTESDASRFSPGLILLKHIIDECARRGFGSFDIGPGEAHYKSHFCKDIELIYDSVLPLSARGALAAPALRAALSTRSMIKRNPLLWRIAHRVRSRFTGRRQSGN